MLAALVQRRKSGGRAPVPDRFHHVPGCLVPVPAVAGPDDGCGGHGARGLPGGDSERRLGPVRADEGLLREALTSLYSLFDSTREIPRRHGPEIAEPKRDGQYNFGYLAVAMLNLGVRPLPASWHPALEDWEGRRPSDRSRHDYERAWPEADRLRTALDDTRRVLTAYADLLATACGVPNLLGAHDQKGLKHRSRKAVRAVPIPPQLVAVLRWHITVYGVAPDGRLFRTARGGMVQESGYGEVRARARSHALAPEEVESKLAKRPYDLRHTAVSTWLSAGVEPQIVATRAGHSLAVLFRVYAKFLKGGEDAANAKISARLNQHRNPSAGS
ncbi:hypothetical protein [Streptomyces sp. NPDC019890]|uniref:hypothetical protein n=1 Tax=Streptomyces sp. NPDC019890 TaxID=3365064 RepID=UPI00384C835B